LITRWIVSCHSSVENPTTLAPRAALALTADEASQAVKSTIDALLELVRSPGDADSKAARLNDIMDKHAAMPQIARFAAGVAWRSMNDDQQQRFVPAFGKFLSTVYARRFQEYSGAPLDNAYAVGAVRDAGAKGMLVTTTIKRPDGPPVDVDWLVSDKPGHPVIADIVIEGVSMLITQRDEIGAMLEKRGGDVDKLIQDLSV